jgi:DNA-3-methyladenine glycosylase II
MSSKHMNGTDTEPPDYWPGACRKLRRADKVMGGLIRRAGRSSLRPRRDAFFSLARSIVGQQISVLAAESVWRKLSERLGAVTPAALAAEDEDSLRACGLSRQKVRYLTSLAGHFLDGALELEAWPALDDEAVIARLCQVDGIGRWTAEMFLIFHLTRPDVLPVADLGLQKAIGRHYACGPKPTPAEMRAIAEPWRPWRSVAVWYLWRSLDAVPVEY